MAATDIDQVVAALDRIIDQSVAEKSRIGYFAALYRKVTLKIRDDVAAGDVFDDDERMERLDVVFANRYLDALREFRQGRPCGEAWRGAFEAAGRRRLIIAQQLLAGTNVHVNLDLGAAAAAVCPGDQIEGLRADFDRINAVLGDMVGGVLAQVGELSPWIGLLDRVGGRTDDAVINFSIGIARREAWKFAEALAPVADPQPLIAERDRIAAHLGHRIINPGWLISSAALVVKAREVKDVRRVIGVLSEDAG